MEIKYQYLEDQFVYKLIGDWDRELYCNFAKAIFPDLDYTNTKYHVVDFRDITNVSSIFKDMPTVKEMKLLII